MRGDKWQRRIHHGAGEQCSVLGMWCSLLRSDPSWSIRRTLAGSVRRAFSSSPYHILPPPNAFAISYSFSQTPRLCHNSSPALASYTGWPYLCQKAGSSCFLAIPGTPHARDRPVSSRRPPLFVDYLLASPFTPAVAVAVASVQVRCRCATAVSATAPSHHTASP